MEKKQAFHKRSYLKNVTVTKELLQDYHKFPYFCGTRHPHNFIYDLRCLKFNDSFSDNVIFIAKNAQKVKSSQ